MYAGKEVEAVRHALGKVVDGPASGVADPAGERARRVDDRIVGAGNHDSQRIVGEITFDGADPGVVPGGGADIGAANEAGECHVVDDASRRQLAERRPALELEVREGAQHDGGIRNPHPVGAGAQRNGGGEVRPGRVPGDDEAGGVAAQQGPVLDDPGVDVESVVEGHRKRELRGGPVIGGHHHGVVRERELAGHEVAVLGRADGEAAAVEVDDDRRRGLGRRRGAVELASRDAVAHRQVDLIDRHVGNRLGAAGRHQRRIRLMAVADVARAHRRDHQVAQRYGLPVVGDDAVHRHGRVVGGDVAQPVDRHRGGDVDLAGRDAPQRIECHRGHPTEVLTGPMAPDQNSSHDDFIRR